MDVVMRVRAWYTDGRTYRAVSMKGVKRLPKKGAVYFVWFHEDGTRTMYSGGDWYTISESGIDYVRSGEWGTWAPKPEGCAGCIKQGAAVTDDEFGRIHREAWGAVWR